MRQALRLRLVERELNLSGWREGVQTPGALTVLVLGKLLSVLTPKHAGSGGTEFPSRQSDWLSHGASMVLAPTQSPFTGRQAWGFDQFGAYLFPPPTIRWKPIPSLTDLRPALEPSGAHRLG